jgi:hypothetical protein
VESFINAFSLAAGEQVCHHRLFYKDPLEAALLKPLWVISPRKSNLKILFSFPASRFLSGLLPVRKPHAIFLAKPAEKNWTIWQIRQTKRERDWQAHTHFLHRDLKAYAVTCPEP